MRIFIFSHCEGGAFLRRPQQSIDRRSACAPVYGSPRRYATDVARLVMTKERGSVGGYIIIKYHRRRFDNARRVAEAQKNMTQI